MRDLMITSSVLITAVLLIRYLTKGRLNPILQYALWLPVALRLVIPVSLWNSSFSVLNLFPEQRAEDSADRFAASNAGGFGDLAGTTGPDAGSFEDMEGFTGAETSNAGGYGNSEGVPGGRDMGSIGEAPRADSSGDSAGALHGGGKEDLTGTKAAAAMAAGPGILSPDLKRMLSGIWPFIWSAGVLFTGGYMVFFQLRWKRYLRENRKPLAGWKKYRGRLSVYTVRNLPSPCLSGRCIYLTGEMAKDERQLKHILAHEYCHYRHLDFLWVIVRCVLTVVYWFHPLVWAAAFVSKQDSELACDEAAICLLGERERTAYGKTLLRLIAGESCDRGRIGIASTMSGGERGIRERICRIAGKRNYVAVTAGIVLLLSAAVAVVTFTGAKKAQGTADEPDMGQNMTTVSDFADGQNGGTDTAEQPQKAQEPEALWKEQTEAEMEALKKEEAVLEEHLQSEIEKMERERGVLEKLASYDADIGEKGSREGVYGIEDALNPSDFVQAHYEEGEKALKEGMYLLETHKGPDGSDIRVYGMYSKEYGCEGIKILIGEKASDFDEPWMIRFCGMEENIRVYESTEDGMPRTFAFKTGVVNSSDSEIWNLHLCDRDESGKIELLTIRPGELLEEIKGRLSFAVDVEEGKVDVYDKGKKVFSIPVEASGEAMRRIDEVIIGENAASWELGRSESEIRMIFAIGLKAEGTDGIWYSRLPLLGIEVSCGSAGERKVRLGQTEHTDYVNALIQEADTFDQYLGLAETSSSNDESETEAVLKAVDGSDDSPNLLTEAVSMPGETGHHDLAVSWLIPCPSYTQISDTFGTETHPQTGEQRSHNGIDFAAEKGADILAAADGVVYRTGYESAGGNYVILYHGQSGEFTYYTCCQDILVSEGNSVTAGQKIATVGNTGRSTGPHLHFALSRDGEFIEPVFE